MTALTPTAAASPQPADPTRDETLQLVRDNVRRLLTQSAAFRALPPERQRQVAHDTVTVARYIADAGGATAGVPMTAIIDNPAAAPVRPFLTAPAQPRAPDGSQQGFTDASDGFNAAATSELAGQAEALVDAIDFPGFVAGLIEGVFTAIVKTSIQQMEAYATMVANVAKTTRQYMNDNVSAEAAKDQLVNAQPDLFEADLNEGQVKQRADADPEQMGGFLQSLGLPFELDTSDPETIQAEVVPKMRESMAMDRQKLLATMVLMGINRVVVTDGRIQASVVFDMSARDVLQRNYRRSTSFEENYNKRHNKQRKNGWWIFSTEKESESSFINVKTAVDTTQADQSQSAIELKTKLTGNVDLRFKSDYFPLEKMLDMLGTNQTALTQVATQPTPQQAQQVQAVAAPPPPPLPPPPAFAGGPGR